MKSNIDLIEFHNILKRPLILDGAMGSLLLEKGINNHPILWTSLSNIENSETVINLHKEYIQAGADIITTNTFRTNPYSVKVSNLNLNIDFSTWVENFVRTAVQNAKLARGSNQIVIAGSNAPAEDCYQKDRKISLSELMFNHQSHIRLLWESNVDIIWNETQSHFDEIEIICKYCSENKIPFVINIFFIDELNILSGHSVHDVVNYVGDYNPVAVGFNCIKPHTFLKYLEKYDLPEKWGFYFNCGAGNYSDEKITCGISPESYVDIVRSLLRLNPLFIGSCCGSNPNHTKAIKALIDEIYRD